MHSTPHGIPCAPQVNTPLDRLGG
ncbi:hypothetical protein RDI58_013605 [Solanum bulbocastanum]|uniref:Uncharacterized protein n=1 Tax=Solanum bulbocastanum TaxID=147425 RepID=A0AAN8YEA9_SOLBU